MSVSGRLAGRYSLRAPKPSPRSLVSIHRRLTVATTTMLTLLASVCVPTAVSSIAAHAAVEEPPAPEHAAIAGIDTLSEHVADLDPPAGDAKKLVKELEKAVEELGKYEFGKACQKLDTFVEEVDKQADKNELTADQVESLEAAVDGPRTQIGCTPGADVQDAIGGLSAQIEGLTTGDPKKLAKELGKAVEELGKYRLDKACEKLDSFVGEVAKQADKDALSAEDAASLTDAATALKAAVGCGVGQDVQGDVRCARGCRRRRAGQGRQEASRCAAQGRRGAGQVPVGQGVREARHVRRRGREGGRQVPSERHRTRGVHRRRTRSATGHGLLRGAGRAPRQWRAGRNRREDRVDRPRGCGWELHLHTHPPERRHRRCRGCRRDRPCRQRPRHRLGDVDAGWLVHGWCRQHRQLCHRGPRTRCVAGHHHSRDDDRDRVSRGREPGLGRGLERVTGGQQRVRPRDRHGHRLRDRGRRARRRRPRRPARPAARRGRGYDLRLLDRCRPLHR